MALARLSDLGILQRLFRLAALFHFLGSGTAPLRAVAV